MNEAIKEIFREKRWYSKNHRKEFVETHFLELLGEGVLEGVARHNPKAFEVAHAILNHLESKIKEEGK
jgi:hypothetical protein